MGDMVKQQNSQIQLQKEIENVADKLDRLEEELKLLVKKMDQQGDPGLDKGLKELSEGKGRLFRSMKQWSAAMKA